MKVGPTGEPAFRHNRTVRTAISPVFGAVLVCATFVSQTPSTRSQDPASKRITWEDVVPLRAGLEARGITSASFPSYVARVHDDNARRVRDGDLDHLVFYVLQSARFTSSASIEPALSAKELVDSLSASERDVFLREGDAPASRVPEPVRARLASFIRALNAPTKDARLTYFRELLNATVSDPAAREPALVREYLRAMKFVYEKEFVAQRSADPGVAVADLYRSRGLSTDTAVEAGFLVYHGLSVVKALEPLRRIRRVLIVGPGLDLAPRTSLLEVGPPESYQPWAVIDAVVSRGLARLDALEVVAADINPRVVDHLRRARATPPVLTLVSGIGESDTVTFAQEYRDYFAGLGRTIGEMASGDMLKVGAERHLLKIVRVNAAAARTLQAAALDIVTERQTGPAFDLVIATNILPYFDDVQLMCAMSNISAMLAPRGVFIHNETRQSLQTIAPAVGLPLAQSRHVIIASVRGARGPLIDSVFLHSRIVNP